LDVAKEMRQVTRLCDDGHQTQVITSRWDLRDIEVAYRMFERGRQENFFKYMREEFLLDALVDYRIEPEDPTRSIRFLRQSPGRLETFRPAPRNRLCAGLRGGGRISLQPISHPNSLITGKITGNFLNFGPFGRFSLLKGQSELCAGLEEAQEGVAAIAARIASCAAADLALGDLATNIVFRSVGVERNFGPFEHHQQFRLVGIKPCQQAVEGDETGLARRSKRARRAALRCRVGCWR
jgi:hypothetical protein